MIGRLCARLHRHEQALAEYYKDSPMFCVLLYHRMLATGVNNSSTLPYTSYTAATSSRIRYVCLEQQRGVALTIACPLGCVFYRTTRATLILSHLGGPSRCRSPSQSKSTDQIGQARKCWWLLTLTLKEAGVGQPTCIRELYSEGYPVCANR
eukprot:2308985-Amphidinium_carterae.1